MHLSTNILSLSGQFAKEIALSTRFRINGSHCFYCNYYTLPRIEPCGVFLPLALSRFLYLQQSGLFDKNKLALLFVNALRLSQKMSSKNLVLVFENTTKYKQCCLLKPFPTAFLPLSLQPFSEAPLRHIIIFSVKLFHGIVHKMQCEHFGEK